MRLFNVMACSIEAFRMIEGSVSDGKRAKISSWARQRTPCLTWNLSVPAAQCGDHRIAAAL